LERIIYEKEFDVFYGLDCSSSHNRMLSYGHKKGKYRNCSHNEL
jgi:hypothetical protein